MLTDMTEGKPWRLILMFTLPMLAGNLFQQLYNTVDAIVVGRYVGPNALGAVSTSFPAIFLLVSAIFGLTMGMGIIISQFYGAGQHDKVRTAVSTSYVATIVAAIVMTFVGLLLIEPLLHLLNVPEEIFADSLEYARIYFFGIFFMFGYNILAGTLRSLGDSRSPLIFLVISAVTNIILDIYFVASLGWGVAGVAWATLIAQGVSMVLCYIYIYFRVPLIAFTPSQFVFDWDILKSMIKLGVPSAIQQSVFSLGMMALQGLVNSFGTTTLAAYAAGNKVDSFVAMPIMNFGQALSTFCGQNVGAWKLDRVKEGLWSTLKMSLLVCAFTSVTLFFAGPLVLQVFLDPNDLANVEVLAQGQQYLQTMALFYWCFALMNTFSGVLRGCGDTLTPMITSLVSLSVRIGVAYMLAPTLGHNSIWVSFPAGWAAGAIIPVLRYASGKWREKARDRYEQMLKLTGLDQKDDALMGAPVAFEGGED